jgi:hypothetical protein
MEDGILTFDQSCLQWGKICYFLKRYNFVMKIQMVVHSKTIICKIQYEHDLAIQLTLQYSLFHTG